MKVSTITAIISFATMSTALVANINGNTDLIERQTTKGGANGGRPVPNGACCVANTSLNEDVCTVNGQQGKCVPSDSAGCNARLTCVPNNKLKCDQNVLENGKPRCREID